MTPRDDDHDWLQALRGQPPADADPATLREAAWLREAHRRWPARLPLEQPSETDMIALLQRARREAGAVPRQAETPRPWWRRWLTPGPLAGAAVAAMLAVTLVPWTAVETLRSGAPAVVRQADPAAARDALAAELRAAGVDVRTYERNGRWGLDAELPAPLPPAVAASLARRGLERPADGALMVEYEPAAGRP